MGDLRDTRDLVSSGIGDLVTWRSGEFLAIIMPIPRRVQGGVMDVPVMRLCAWSFTIVAMAGSAIWASQPRSRARDLGIAPGDLKPGAVNAITDVPGVLVGHVT